MTTTAKSIGGTLRPSGALKVIGPVYKTGTISFAGALGIVGPVHASGTLRFVGADSPKKRAVRATSGTLRFTGRVSKSSTKGLAGTLRFYGDVTRDIAGKHSSAGTLRFVGLLTKVVTKVPKYRSNSGRVSMGGMLSSHQSENQHNAGTVSFLGALGQAQTGKASFGTVRFSGTPTPVLGKNPRGTITFTGVIGPRYFGEGTVTFGGALSAGFRKPLSGQLNFHGDCDIAQHRRGTLRLSGSLVRRSAGIHKGGTVTLRGSLSTPEQQAVGGRLSFMRVLSLLYVPYTYGDVSVMNMAASYDIEIEQGVSFSRKFRWLKDDGVPFDLNDFALFMSIRPYKNASALTLTSNGGGIVITKSATETGVFTVTISSSYTIGLTFTRGVYDIIAKWGSGYSTRLVEGEVILSKGVTSGIIYREGYAGTLTFNGALAPALTKAPSGTIHFTGNMTRLANHLSAPAGTLSFAGSIAKASAFAVAGTMSFSGALTPLKQARTAGTVTFSGTLSNAMGHESSGTVYMIGRRT